MQGFEDTSNPVKLFLREGSALGTGPFEIDGVRASLTADGIRADVGGTRYFVPTHLIDHVEQDQTPAEVPLPPVVVSPGQSGGQGNGGGRDGQGRAQEARSR